MSFSANRRPFKISEFSREHNNKARAQFTPPMLSLRTPCPKAAKSNVPPQLVNISGSNDRDRPAVITVFGENLVISFVVEKNGDSSRTDTLTRTIPLISLWGWGSVPEYIPADDARLGAAGRSSRRVFRRAGAGRNRDDLHVRFYRGGGGALEFTRCLVSHMSTLQYHGACGQWHAAQRDGSSHPRKWHVGGAANGAPKTHDNPLWPSQLREASLPSVLSPQDAAHGPSDATCMLPARNEPVALCCPISGNMYRDPWLLADSGNTYERDALARFWDNRAPCEPRDPLTMAPCSTLHFKDWGKQREVRH